MEILRFRRDTGSLRLRVDTLEDLWSVQRILSPDDLVRSETLRRFRPNEGDEGELKEVVIKVRLEKTELDRNAQRLRVTGKIVEGRPLEFVRLNTYHTLNIGPKDILEVTKQEWHGYLLAIIKEAVARTGRPRLAIIAVDEEKALPAYLLGYGIDFMDCLYSKLSKRMKPKDFTEQQSAYFEKLIALMARMNTDLVVIAGPGFTTENLKRYMAEHGTAKKLEKRLMFMQTSNTERSGVYELIKSDSMTEALEREQVRSEFRLMEEFLKNVGLGRAHYGAEKVSAALKNREVSTVLANDSVLWDERIKGVLNEAERAGVKIVIFNSLDEAGIQLSAFRDIAAI